jgi:hypothetical protein
VPVPHDPLMPPALVWTSDALERLQRAPAFLRGMVQRLAEKQARDMGRTEITGALLEQFKSQTMGGIGAAVGGADATHTSETGRLPWTTAARQRLETIPVFLQAMLTRIAEDCARERGHLEVNVDVLATVEALGDTPDDTHHSLAWTDGARRTLEAKMQGAPPMALDFLRDLLTHDAEDLAHARGLDHIDETTLQHLWDTPHEPIPWTSDAWERLLTAPAFVRSGIRKAAERRARKLGLQAIDSAHLTQFRNEAMMKAVKRIRRFGYNELTFAAFDDALATVKRLQGNAQAEQRLADIRAYMHANPNRTGVLGDALMERFRRYLTGEATL